MDRNKVLFKRWVTIFTVYGTIQGLIWALLSCTAILGRVGLFGKGLASLDNYFDYIFVLFITDQNYTTLRNINANQFLVFNIFYCAVSFIWFILSAVLLWAIRKNKVKDKHKNTFYVWSSVIIASSIIDVIIFILILVDMNKLQSYFESKGSTLEPKITSSYICMAIILLRGGIFWGLNLIAAGMMIKYGINISNLIILDSDKTINTAYDSSGPPSDWFDRGLQNHGYQPDRQSYYNDYKDYDSQSGNYPDNISGRNYYINDAVDLPFEVLEAPYIPTPDYTPPTTPTPSLRPALKRQMRYTMRRH